MGFPRKGYWSGLPSPSLGYLPKPRMEPVSPALADGFFTTQPPGGPSFVHYIEYIKLNEANNQEVRSILYTLVKVFLKSQVKQRKRDMILKDSGAHHFSDVSGHL